MNDTLIDALTSGWQVLGRPAASALRIAVILAAAWLTMRVLRSAIHAFRARVVTHLDNPEAVKRAETLDRVLRYAMTVVVSLLTGMLVLAEMGISVAPILGAAGVAGVAVGFGAQSLVKDFFTGIFLLIEDQIRQGDQVRIGEHVGTVEEITLRYVQLRDYDGHVHYLPNSTISAVVNMSRSYAQAVMDVRVPIRENADRVMQIMSTVAAELRADPAYSGRILGPFEMAGVERFDEVALVIRARLKVLPLEQAQVRREFLRRFKAAYDAPDPAAA